MPNIPVLHPLFNVLNLHISSFGPPIFFLSCMRYPEKCKHGLFLMTNWQYQKWSLVLGRREYWNNHQCWDTQYTT